MKVFQILFLTAMVAIAMDKCVAKYLLVEIEDEIVERGGSMFNSRTTNECSWSKWSECSESCGNGFMERVRTNTAGKSGKDNCIGLPKETKRCQIRNNNCEGIPGWFIGEIYKDCNVTCAAHSLVCTENEMWNHNSDVDSPKKLAKLINRLQGMNSFSSCYGHYGNFTDVPNFSTSERFCLNSSPGKPRENVNCGQTPNYQSKKRLCYCHSG